MLYLTNITVRVYPYRTGRFVDIPGLMDDHGVVKPLVWYLLHKSSAGRSQSTLNKIREAFRLFYEYTSAVDPGGDFGRESGAATAPWQHFSRFRDDLIHGTFNSLTGADPTGLAWRPSSIAKANTVVKHLTDFFIWADQEGARNAQRFNPEGAADRHDQLMQRAAYEYKRGKAFLGHTWRTPEDVEYTSRTVTRVRELRSAQSEPKRFPDEHFTRLLKDGFTTRSASGLRDILITILLNKGGLRESEPMHLWIIDVTEDPICGARVVIKHPSQGEAPLGPGRARYANREDFLARVHKKLPRNLQRGSMHSGWKSIYKELEVQWFEPVWGKHFWLLWKRYLTELVRVPRDHPWAFISFSGPERGRPLPLRTFYDLHTAAVYRATLPPRDGAVNLKALGLTAHGHRHAYAHRAKNKAGLSSVVVQRMLHHSSPESQDAYTQLSRDEQLKVLGEASARMNTRDDWDGSLLIAADRTIIE